MLIIKHRVNTVKELKTLPIEYGVEVDIRSNNKDLVISHDPFQNGEKLMDWLNEYNHAFIIFNIKEEGIEFILLDLIKKLKIKNYFLLDQSFPFYIKNIKLFGKNSSIRISEYECIETVLRLKNFTEWLWVDHFSVFPLNINQIKTLKSLKFKFCIVSPELVNTNNVSEKISFIKKKFKDASIDIDAVCTKRIKDWNVQ
jgi:hypothetical protein